MQSEENWSDSSADCSEGGRHPWNRVKNDEYHKQSEKTGLDRPNTSRVNRNFGGDGNKADETKETKRRCPMPDTDE